MIEFFRLSYRKLLIIWVVVSLLFFLLISIFIILAYAFNGDNMEKVDSWVLTEIYMLLGCIGLAFPMMILIFFSEYREFYVYRKLFQKVPFSQLDQVGFAPTPLLKSGIWKLYKEVYAARINKFHVVAEQSGKAMAFTILTEEDVNVKMMSVQHFRDAYVSSSQAGILIIIPIDSYSTPGIGTLQTLLTNMTLNMINDGLHPAPDLYKYEKMLKGEVIKQAMRGALPG